LVGSSVFVGSVVGSHGMEGFLPIQSVFWNAVLGREFMPGKVVFHSEECIDLCHVDKVADVAICVVLGQGWQATKVLKANVECAGWLRLLQWVTPGCEVGVWCWVGHRLHSRSDVFFG